MVSEILEFLVCSKEKPVSCIIRKSGVLLLGIGDKITLKSLDKLEPEEGQVIFYIDSPWRITDLEMSKVILGSDDMRLPKSSEEFSEDFDWTLPDSNLFDEKIEIWKAANPVVHVEDIKANLWGDISIYLSNKQILQVMVDTSNNVLCWHAYKKENVIKRLDVHGEGMYVLGNETAEH